MLILGRGGGGEFVTGRNLQRDHAHIGRRRRRGWKRRGADTSSHVLINTLAKRGCTTLTPSPVNSEKWPLCRRPGKPVGLDSSGAGGGEVKEAGGLGVGGGGGADVDLQKHQIRRESPRMQSEGKSSMAARQHRGSAAPMGTVTRVHTHICFQFVTCVCLSGRKRSRWRWMSNKRRERSVGLLRSSDLDEKRVFVFRVGVFRHG